MKILVIPDIHCRKFWREAIYNNLSKVEKVVFLGDYIDPYQEEINEHQELMECNDFYDCIGSLNMLNDIISLKKNEPDKYILLTGNHTDSYIWSKFSAAERTDYRNWEKYHKFFLENLEYFNLVFIQGKTIFSHAGITNGWINHVWEYFEYPENEIPTIMEIAKMFKDTPLDKFNKDYINVISDISRHRDGFLPYGSCEWADILEHIDLKNSTSDNIIPTQKDEGIYQIFGHSQLKAPLITSKWACLDCRKAFIVDTNTFKVEAVDGSESSI